MASQGTPVKRPDFAFPEKVSASSEKELATALAAGNDVGALRAALNLTLAQNSIDSDRMPTALATLDSLTDRFSTPAPRAVCELMQATIYSAYYTSQQWTIDQRPDLPAGTKPSRDYTEWNRAQFEARVSELLNSALANPDALLATPLRTYDSLLAVSSADARVTYTFYPSLLDFVAGQAIQLMSDFRTPAARQLVSEYRALLIRLNAGHPAPFVVASLSSIMANPLRHDAMRASLMSLYSNMSESEYSGEVLLALGNITDNNNIPQCRELKDSIDTFLHRYPSYIRAGDLRNLLSVITRPRVQVNFHSLVVPGNELSFSAKSYNAPEVTVTLYRLPSGYNDTGDDYYPLKNGVIPSSFRSVATRKLTFEGTAPFMAEGSSTIPVNDAGLYILVANAPGMNRDSNPRIVRATSLAPGSLAFGKNVNALVVNPLTGQPVADALIIRCGNRTAELGSTGTDGMLPLPKSERGNVLFRPVKDSDTFAPQARIWLGNNGDIDSTRHYYVEAYTDLSLYHPGDTVRFAAILYSIRERQIKVAPGETVEAVIYDANRQSVDTVKAVTDRFGRIEGSALLPDDGRLNGRYFLSVSYGKTTGRAFFTVSDYKLPSFEVVIDPAQTGVPEKGGVTLSGHVVTYSGMPLADADVAVRIEREYLWRYGLEEESSLLPLDLAAHSGADGRWSIVVPSAQLGGTDINSWFSVSVTATSQAGESQAARTVFALGPALRVRAVLPVAIDVTNPVTLPVEVYGPSGKSVDGVRVNYTVVPEASDSDDSNNASAVASGSFLSGRNLIDLSNVTPGIYTINFTIDGDSRSCRGIALYRPDVNRSPSSDLLWTPDNRVTLSPGAGTDILIGTSMDSTWVLYTLYDFERIIERRWMVLPAGLHHITMATEHGGSPDLRASFIATGHYTTSQLDINIHPSIDPRGLTIRAESMRDRVIPGSTEKWTFKVVDALGTPVEAAVMADMYNKALDAIISSGWSLSIQSPRSLYLSVNYPNAGNREWLYLSSSYSRAHGGTGYSLPEFQLYGQTLAPQTWRLRGNMMMGAPRMMKAEGVAAVAESSKAVMTDMVADADEAVTSGVEEESVGENDMGSGDAESAPFSYRDPETPLALFRPMLVTGRDGNLELTFNLPDANTTWAFQALAFTDDMRATRFTASVLASKPIMVKPNLPRFLREADRATVLTSVMNSTDSLITADVVIELFDPSTGKVLARHNRAVDIAGGATEILSAEVEAPLNLPMIGFRAKATTTLFADGEQALIPILPASARIVDSETFYMGPETAEATIDLPTPPDLSDAVTTLEFCENPVWYVVTALPGLAVSEPVTAPQAAASLFSAAVAQGLIHRYPAIAQALADWTAQGADNEMLTSMLERNPDLKTLLLQATPWVMDARSDTERMQRLSLLFDTKRVNRAISDAIALLEKLSRDSGGWAWIAQINEPSQWATNTVLARLATLSALGFLPDDRRLGAMTSKAVNYIDREAEKIYAAHPSQPQTSYSALRSMFPSVKTSATVDKILAASTQAVVSGWKKIPLSSRPEAAMFLWRRNYRSVAREILASMREFMVTDPEKGSYFPSLQNSADGYLIYTSDALRAFAEIEPGAAEIDGLRHWLVVQKQATDWGTTPEATEIVAAILTSSSEWIADAKGASVEVNGKKLDLPGTDRRLGYFRVPLTGMQGRDINVTVRKKSPTPAWGALIRTSTRPLLSIEAAGSADLSIEKSIIASDSLCVGRKVTVRLVIRVGRNLNYVAVTDERAACFEPVDQLPSVQFSQGVTLYVEPRDSRTSIFATTLPKGTYVVSYDLYVNNAGTFASGIAEAASQYAPEITARSAASEITVNK